MESILYFGAFVLITLFISVIFLSKRRSYRYSKKVTAPPWANDETNRLFQQFNLAWSNEIEKIVNPRIKKVDSSLTNRELNDRWYELKKFLFLAGVSKGLPMFSTKIDGIWHYFLEEQELYNKFCLAFIGEHIEHHPHESPKHLPAERAWFDLLYLSFFSITSSSHLWGEFVQEKKEIVKWTERLMNNPKEIIESFGRKLSDATSVHTLTAFLEFAKKQMMKTTRSQEERLLRTDGYWYGAALFSYYGYDTVQEEIKKEKANSAADGSIGFADSPNREEEWNEIVTDVNTFETVSDAGTTSSGDSDSGSSCSSCSGCSS